MEALVVFVIIILMSFVINAQNNEGNTQKCSRCDVTDEDYSRGWIEACQIIKTVLKPHEMCHFDIMYWKFVCRTYWRPESEVTYSCCPSFTLQHRWCSLPPRPAPTPQQNNELPIETKTCGISKYPNSGTRLTYIVGGFTSWPYEFPWQVSVRLGTDGSQGHLCGGSIISSTLIVTAAHCAYYYEAFPDIPKYVVVGEFDRDRQDTSQATYDILEVIFNPYYNRETVDNDLALLRLESPIQFSDDIQPVCLPSTDAMYTNQEAIVIGWGSRKFGGMTARLLQFARLHVMSNVECKNRLRRYGVTVTDSMMCASDGDTLTERDSCQGDSGGPLVVEKDGRYTVIGLVSWGLGCAVGTPGVYTRVSRFSDWINQYM